MVPLSTRGQRRRFCFHVQRLKGSTHLPIRSYVCRQCGATEDIAQQWNDATLTVCPQCNAPSFQRVYSPPLFSIKGGQAGRLVNGERRFRREVVTQERDGSETVYRSLAEARQGEREKAAASSLELPAFAQHRLAEHNVTSMRKTLGVLPGTKAAEHAAAMEEPRR